MRMIRMNPDKINDDRIHVCEECFKHFTERELLEYQLKPVWGHPCKAKKFRETNYCESYLQPYIKQENQPPQN